MPVSKGKAEALAAAPSVAGTVAMQAWMDISTEAVRFVWNRLQEDMKTQQALLACKSLDEIREVQAGFFTAAQQDYAQEAERMLEMLSKATGQALQAGPRRYDDVPL